MTHHKAPPRTGYGIDPCWDNCGPIPQETQHRTAFADMPLPSQAGILCKDPQFQSFAGTRSIGGSVQLTSTAAAEYLCMICGINSRADLATNTAAAARFAALRTEYDAWRGRIAQRH